MIQMENFQAEKWIAMNQYMILINWVRNCITYTETNMNQVNEEQSWMNLQMRALWSNHNQQNHTFYTLGSIMQDGGERERERSRGVSPAGMA
jgi:hypothetical protein